MKPVYQFAQPNIKLSKKEWNSLSYYRGLLMKQFGKREMHNNLLMCEAKEYSQIVVPSSLRNIVYYELHSKMGALGNC